MSTRSKAASAVTADRKQALLLEARRARISWVDSASFPFRNSLATSSDAETFDGQVGEDGMSIIKATRACVAVKSAVNVVTTLYGASNSMDGRLSLKEAGEKIKRQIESDVSHSDMDKLFASPASLRNCPEGEVEGSSQGHAVLSVKNNDYFVSSYRQFIQKLRSPECAELVQGMRHFVASFVDMAHAFVKNPTIKKTEKADDDVGDVAHLSSVLNSYLETLYEATQSHAAWKSEGELSAMTKQSIDVFIFAKCHHAIWSILATNETKEHDLAIENRVAALQFITPLHLEIACLVDSDDPDNSTWVSALSAPIASLQAINDQYSPGQMLRCILDVYRGVNETLFKAMKSLDDGKLPGADDVLPTLIITLLSARPSRILSNLKFIENFAIPKQFRGEAGYAFTNLYGAVQFIRDLDMDQCANDGIQGTVSGGLLTISPTDFRAGIKKCTSIANEKVTVSPEHDETAENADDKTMELGLTRQRIEIPAQEIRAARLRGEVVDIDWARRWHELNTNRLQSTVGSSLPGEPSNSQMNADHTSYLPPPPLPVGFTRSFKFLASEPGDVRVSDISELLREYRMLVHATESLLTERFMKHNEQQKRQVERTRSILESNAADLSTTT